MAEQTYAQTQLIPASELNPGAAASIRNSVMRSLIELASKELVMPPWKLVVRDIRPLADLDYTYEDWIESVGATAATFETMATGTMGDQRYVGIYGIKLKEDNADVCSQVRFNIGGGLKALWHIQSLSKYDDYTGFCPSGIIITQNTIYTIERYVRMVSVPFFCLLKGVVVEPRGKVIGP